MLILRQETQLAVLGTSSCYFIYKGDCSLPLCGRLEGPLGLLLEHKDQARVQTSHASLSLSKRSGIIILHEAH